jgi:hypothetical protein
MRSPLDWLTDRRTQLLVLGQASWILIAPDPRLTNNFVLTYETGICVRAELPNSEIDSVDIAYLDKDSLKHWLRSGAGANELAEGVVLILLGHRWATRFIRWSLTLATTIRPTITRKSKAPAIVAVVVDGSKCVPPGFRRVSKVTA